MLRPVIHDVHQHLPNGQPLVDVLDDAVRDGREPGIDCSPLGFPSFAQLLDRRQRLQFGLEGLAGLMKSVAPALRRAEVVDEDAPQTSLVDDVRPRPYGRVHAVEDTSTRRVAHRS